MKVAHEKIEANQEQMRAEMRASQEEMKASMNTSQEEMKVAISTIQSAQAKFEITITKWVEGFLLVVD
jgi:hypothetical protein